MSENAQILLVDDDQDVRRLIVRILKGKQFHVVEASSAEEAYQYLLHHKPLLLLLDIGLPEKTGLELLRDLRGKENDILTIFLTGLSEKAIIKEALSLQAFSFLEKPIDYDLLIHEVQRGLEFALYKKELGQILEYLVCEYGKLTWDQYLELSVQQKANLLSMIKGILSLKAIRQKVKSPPKES